MKDRSEDDGRDLRASFQWSYMKGQESVAADGVIDLRERNAESKVFESLDDGVVLELLLLFVVVEEFEDNGTVKTLDIEELEIGKTLDIC